jgi:ADP-heptose:LPS heptosyltransferase
LNSRPNQPSSPRILVVRRDNIGDLVLTTPLIRALRERYPHGWIGALVNSYNAPVLRGNPDLDEVFVYTKAKHRGADESLLGIFWQRWRMLRRLRALRLDEVILAAPSPQPRGIAMARRLAPARIVGFGDAPGLDLALPLSQGELGEAQDVFRSARHHGIDGPPPPCRIMRPETATPATLTIAIHISARKPSQRWPVERFAALMRQLHAQHGARFVLVWSPGAADNPLHPGDDAKAATLANNLGSGFPVQCTPTATLDALITALAGCHAMICADGGAMHLAAGLGLPLVCLFGDSDALRWRPWGVPYRLLQKESRQVADIEVAEVAAAFSELRDGIPAPASASPL